MSSVVLRNRGGDVNYDVRFGHFDAAEGKLDIELELSIADPDNEDAPPELLVRLANLPFAGRSRTLRVRDHHDAWGADDGRPHAFVYSGFHHSDVAARVDVLSHDDAEMTVDITLVTDNVLRYDPPARDSSMSGRCVLRREPRIGMWGP